MTTKGLIERHAHWMAAIGVACLHHFAFPHCRPDKPVELLGNVVNLSGIAVGFMATGQALLCSLSDNFVVKVLRKIGRFKEMLLHFSIAIRWCLVLALLSLVGYWRDILAIPFVFSIWLGLFAGAAIATMRILWFFGQVLHGSDEK